MPNARFRPGSLTKHCFEIDWRSRAAETQMRPLWLAASCKVCVSAATEPRRELAEPRCKQALRPDLLDQHSKGLPEHLFKAHQVATTDSHPRRKVVVSQTSLGVDLVDPLSRSVLQSDDLQCYQRPQVSDFTNVLSCLSPSRGLWSSFGFAKQGLTKQ